MINVQAHRGASAYAPENTLPAFRRAVELGADGIECDIHLTTDGQYVVCHDDAVDRTSDGTGLLSEMTAEEARRFNFAPVSPGGPAIGCRRPCWTSCWRLLPAWRLSI